MTPDALPLHDLEGDFLGAQARAETGGAAARLDALLDAKPAAPPAAPAAAAPAPAPETGAAAPASSPPKQKPLSPLGRSLSVTPEERDTPLGVVALHRLETNAQAYASQFGKDVNAAWESLKTDLKASIPDHEAMRSADFWTATKMQIDSNLAAGKSIADAFALALSPLTAAADVATTATGDWYHANYPALDAKAVKDALDKALPGIAPARGGLRNLPKPGEVPPGGEPPPPGEPPPGAAGGAGPKAPFLKPALQAATRDVKIAGEAMTVPEPHAVTILDQPPEVLTQLEDALRSAGVTNLKPLGAGYSSVVFDTGDGRVVRLVPESTEGKRLDLPEILQGTHEGNAGNVHYEVLPKVDTAGISEKDVDDMRSALAQKGYSFNDPGTDQLGKLPNGKLVIVDRDAVYKPTETKPYDPYSKDPEKQAEARARVNAEAQAKPAAGEAAPETAAAAAPGEAPPRDWMFAGQAPDQKGRLRVSDLDRKKAADYLNGKSPDNPVQASLDTLSDEQGARDVIKEVAKFIPEGAVKPDDILEMGAYSLQRTPAEIAAGMKALPTDEEMLSWKMMMDAGGAELKKSADAYRANPTPENLEAFTRNFTLMLRTIQNWDEVGTGMGRAFRARQLAVRDTDTFTQTIRDIVANVGPNNMAEAAEKLASLKDPAKVAPFLQWLRRMKGRDGLVYGWSNILLSNTPKTLSKKLFGDVFSAGLELATTGLSELAGQSPAGSTKQLLFGYFGGFRDAIRMAGRGLKEGRSQFESDYQSVDGVSKSRLEQMGQGFDASTPTKAAISFLRMAMPTRQIGAADDFAKIWHYRAKLHELISVAAKGDNQAYAEMLNNVPQALHEEATAFALKASYQEPLTGLAETLRNAVDRANINMNWTGTAFPLGRILAPFVKVPVNLGRSAYRTSPAPLLFASDQIKADMAAGGARRAKMMAAVGLGTGFSAVIATMVANDQITGAGPKDPSERRFWLKFHQPYSIRIGDTWYGYQGAHPAGLMIGPVADTVETFRYATERDTEDLGVSLAFGVGHALLAPTFMMGAAEFLEALNDPSGDGRRFFENLAGSALAPQATTAIDNAMDPWRRAHYDALQAIQAKTPGASESLMPTRDIWGDPIPRTQGWLPFGLSGGALARAISPVPMQKVGGETALIGGQEQAHAQPIDKWIWDHHEAFARDAEDNAIRIISPPGQAFSYTPRGSTIAAHIKLDDKQLDRLRVLAGNGVKIEGLGAKDAFNRLVEGNHPDAKLQAEWNAGSDALRAVQIQRMWTRYRSAASQALVEGDKGLQDKILKQVQLRQGVLTGGPTRGDRPVQPRFQ